MTDKVFFDTTVLVYSVAAEDHRADIAEKLLAAGGFVSVQVLNEFVSFCKAKLKMPWKEIKEALGAVRALCEPVVPLGLETHEHALEIAEQTGYHIYHALIVAAALRAGCTVLYSEDMQDGRKVGGLTIRNPFQAKQG